MLTSDEIANLPSVIIRNADEPAKIEEAISSLNDQDDRCHLLYGLTKRLLAEGELEAAEKVSRSLDTWPIERTWFFGDIAVKRWEAGQAEHARQLLQEAIPIARNGGVEWQRAESLARIAVRFDLIGDRRMAVTLLAEAAEIAGRGEAQSLSRGNIQDTLDSASTLDEISAALIAVGEPVLARQVAGSIRHDHRRQRALARLNSK
ncbi:MAG TPA: hypothetical protein VFD58_15875 [Blastocatellia bacterium]|nr:hypothetical protein [Blastocatellia bacterium]